VPIHNEQFPDNQALSEKRAESVVNYFVTKGGIESGRLSMKGYGKTKPIDTNDTPEGRRKNRRVEIILLK
jgi:chemotaxis protein MotB